MKAEEAFKKNKLIKTPSGDIIKTREDIEREVQKFKLKVNVDFTQEVVLPDTVTRRFPPEWPPCPQPGSRRRWCGQERKYLSFSASCRFLQQHCYLDWLLSARCAHLHSDVCPDCFTIQMAAHIIYAPIPISPPNASVQLQETRLALLPLRPVLLFNHSQLHFHLDRAIELYALDRLLLLIPRVHGQCCNHMEKQSRVPRHRQGHLLVRPHLRAVNLHRLPVRPLPASPYPIETNASCPAISTPTRKNGSLPSRRCPTSSP